MNSVIHYSNRWNAASEAEVENIGTGIYIANTKRTAIRMIINSWIVDYGWVFLEWWVYWNQSPIPSLQWPWFRYTTMAVRAWLINYISQKSMDMIIYQCPGSSWYVICHLAFELILQQKGALVKPIAPFNFSQGFPILFKWNQLYFLAWWSLKHW